jgi:hypothetical protein
MTDIQYELHTAAAAKLSSSLSIFFTSTKNTTKMVTIHRVEMNKIHLTQKSITLPQTNKKLDTLQSGISG